MTDVQALTFVLMKSLEMQYGLKPEDLLAQAKEFYKPEKESEPLVPANPAEVEEIYMLYPSTDKNNNNRSTGKNKNNRKKIEILLRKMPVEVLKRIVLNYVEECENKGTYMKNFSTFLNSIDPDLCTPEKKTEDEGWQ